MRRADRLFEIVQYLRGRRVTKASELAQWLEVSERTIYRDISDLMASGVPIDGAAGVGYRIAPTFDLPPLMFTLNEVEALVIGGRFVETWGGPGLAAGARSAMTKIAAVLPRDKLVAFESVRMFAPGFFLDPRPGEHLERLRLAMKEHRVAQLDYRDAQGQSSLRRVRPLALYFWGDAWSLAAWCELRADFRTFRLDRIADIALLAERFPDQPGTRHEDFVRRMQSES